MKKIFLLGILICCCLGTWQVYRYFYKKNIDYRLKNCVLREGFLYANSGPSEGGYDDSDRFLDISPKLPKLTENQYCRIKQQYGGKILADKTMFLFKSLHNNNETNNKINVKDHNQINNEEIYYVIVPIQFNSYNLDSSARLGITALINLGYIKNPDRAQILKLLAQENALSFEAIILPAEQKIRLPLLKNDFKNNNLYFLDILELQKNIGVPLEREILYSINNSFAKRHPELIINNKEIEIKILLHIGYAIMWYVIALGGFVIFLLKKPS